MEPHNLPVRIVNPRRLPAWQLPAERIPVGIPGDYKPSMALLPSGELVMVAFHPEKLPEEKCTEWSVIWRSTDGGVTWSDRHVIQDMIGREQWLTCISDGTLFATSHLLHTDINNNDGVVHSYIHRSADGGRTWQRTKVLLEGDERCGVSMDVGWGGHTSRNILELPDETLLLGVSIVGSDVDYLWKSEDGGKTWDRSMRVKLDGWVDAELECFFSEDFTYRTESGKLLHWIRVGPPSPTYPINDGRAVPVGNDGIDRTMVCESYDNGRTWVKLRKFGDYGMHYIRILKLKDSRLLMTFTQRELFYPLGLQAAISYDDGETWDLESDRIIIEGKTPWGYPYGTGFGNTVQIDDGTLVSCYSYFDWDAKSHVEVVRWSLS